VIFSDRDLGKLLKALESLKSDMTARLRAAKDEAQTVETVPESPARLSNGTSPAAAAAREKTSYERLPGQTEMLLEAGSKDNCGDLVWTADDVPLTIDGIDYHAHEAVTALGTYWISINTSLDDSKVTGYSLGFLAAGTEIDETIGQRPVLNEAKSLAQRDHDKRVKAGAAAAREKPPTSPATANEDGLDIPTFLDRRSGLDQRTGR
jgi:hypothetical protein